MELSRNQLLIGSVGLTFLPVLTVYDFFSGIRTSDHFFIFSIAIILWMLGMFFSIFRFALWGTAEDPLTRYFDNASLLNICGVSAGFVITLAYQILKRLGGF